MNSLLRITLLGMFASVGVGLAVCLATVPQPETGLPGDLALPPLGRLATSPPEVDLDHIEPEFAAGRTADGEPLDADRAGTQRVAGPGVDLPPFEAPRPASDTESPAKGATDEPTDRHPTSAAATDAIVALPPAPGVATPLPAAPRQPDLRPRHPLRSAIRATPPATPAPIAPVAASPRIAQALPAGPAAARPSEGQTLQTMLELMTLMRQTQAETQVETPPRPAPTVPAPIAAPQPLPEPPKATVTRDGDGDNELSITIQGADIREVLAMLSEQGDLNILSSAGVQGTVSASLKRVDIATALDAILKSTGFVWRREGDFIYVGTPLDFANMQQAYDRVETRLYRPNYVRAADLQVLLTPLLTSGVGTISVTVAAEVGIAPDGNQAGGDGYADQEAVVVRDFRAVLSEMDQIVAQIDRRPMQVAIEAMILSVKLDDSNELGVDFEALRDNNNARLTSGTPLQDLAALDVNSGGLKFAFIDSNLSLLITALETIGDTNVIATPRLLCLNKQRAEILIGSQLGYVSTTQTETSTTQSVEFLEVGTQLRIRPFISSDGLIRMEVHPELSTGNVRIEDGFTLPDKEVTQVTTNIMVRDGCTVIIGGLMRDELSSTATQIPLLGSLPIVGPAFRQNVETTERREILVLITPRIVYEPDTCVEGDEAACEFHQRHAIYADKMIPFGRRYLGRKYLRLAQEAWASGKTRAALRQVNLAIHFDPLLRAAIDLRNDIWAGNPDGEHALGTEYVPPGDPAELGPASRIDEHPRDVGRPAARHVIQPLELQP